MLGYLIGVSDFLAQREPAEPPTALWETNDSRWDLLAECRLDPGRPASGSYQRKSNRLVRTTDPNAAAMNTRGEQAALGQVAGGDAAT